MYFSRIRRYVLVCIALSLTAAGAAWGQTAQAYELRKAAEINSSNSDKVPLDGALYWMPHNTYNPNEWNRLTDALDVGARALEVDFYNNQTTNDPFVWDDPTSRRYNFKIISGGSQQFTDSYGVFSDILSRVINGQAFDPSRYQMAV